jgi:hypothetical protein
VRKGTVDRDERASTRPDVRPFPAPGSSGRDCRAAGFATRLPSASGLTERLTGVQRAIVSALSSAIIKEIKADFARHQGVIGSSANKDPNDCSDLREEEH